jgi:alpha 1,3-glucosidase
LSFLDLFITNENNYPYIGKCWSGDSSYLDFFNEDTRNYWVNLIMTTNNFFFEAQNIHIWNDMNEPSVFEQPDVTLPRKVFFTYNKSKYEHRDAHNAYGYMMHKTTYEAQKKKFGKRPFVLTRSFYLGSHKFGATWTGDTRAKYEDLELSIPMIITNSLAGYGFIGADVGGFFGDPDVDLLTRWYMLGVFYPFFRAHSHNESYRREPWLYDQITREKIKSSIVLRYKLLPYIYYTFFQYYKSGFPIIRPMWFRYHNKFTFDFYANKQFFFGDALLIRPVLNSAESSSMSLNTYLPEDDRWFDLFSYQEYMEKGERQIRISSENIAVFIKGGSILPLKCRVRRSTKHMRYEPLTLIVAVNNEQSASGMVYFDDEESFDYEESNKYYLKKIHFQKDELFVANLNEEFKIINKIERILILGLSNYVKSVTYHNFQTQENFDLEFVKKDLSLDPIQKVFEIRRLNIPIDNLWKIKLTYSD